MRRFIFERLRSSILGPAIPKNTRKSRPKLRPLACQPLEERRLLSGVTFVTHGAQGLGDDPKLPEWVAGIADEVAVQIGEAFGGAAEDVAQFKMTVEEVDSTIRVTGWEFSGSFAPAAEDTATTYDLADSLAGEAVVSLDWSAIAAPLEVTTQAVAAAVSRFLFTNLTSLGADLLASPIHLIGHSRGASLVGALAEDLGEAGIWVDQVTYLDTHPLEFIVDPDDWGDNSFSVTENVVFGDSYWREDLDPLDFDGEVVPGAYNAELNEDILDDGVGYSSAHSNVHLWYHGTIDTTEGIHDGEMGLTAANLATWYDTTHEMAGPRGQTGYHYSRVAGGSRPGAGVTTALGGEGARSTLTWTVAVWPNMLGLEMSSAQRNFAPGDKLNVEFYHQDYDGPSSARFYLDPDQNPYNDNAILVSGQSGQTLEKTGAAPVAESGVGDLTGVALGEYFLLGSVSDEAGHIRYAYAADSIRVGTPAPAITDLEADPATIDEGGTTTLSCGFTDASLVDVHTVLINWGDGSSDTFDLTAGERGFSRPHRYLDDYSAGAAGDPYTVTVTVTDDDGGTDSKTTSIAVANVAPVVATVDAVTINEGDRFTRDVTFTDPGDDRWTAEVNYGDAAGWQPATLEGRAVKLDYDFDAEVGTHSVSVRVSDDQGAVGTSTFSVTVENVAPSLWVRGLRVVDEGAELNVANLGIFTDPGFYDVQVDTTAFRYEIDWADGSTPDTGNADVLVSGSSGKLTWGSFDGAHTYEEDGRYVVTITLEDDAGGISLERSMTVIVNNVAPRTLVVDDIAAVTEGDIAYVHGTFNDGALDTHTVTVSWGDGTPDTVVVLPSGQMDFTIPTTPLSDPHRYADDGPNTTPGQSPSGTHVYSVRVTVADGDGGSISVDETVEVTNAAPQVTPIAAQQISEGESFSKVLASFADAGTVDVHTALIDWGDGTAAEAGVVDSTARTVSGTHVYAEQNEDDTGNVIPYTVTVTVTDDDGGSASGTLAVTVSNAAPVLGPMAAANVNEGVSFTLGLVSFADAGTSDTHTAVIDWGDGTEPQAGTVDPVARTVTGTHVYADEKEDGTGNIIPYTVTVTVTDDDGAADSGTVAVTVANVAPELGEIAAATVNEDEIFAFGPTSFVDKGTLDTHTALVNWGDGTEGQATVVESPAGPPGNVAGLTGTITATHTYASERVDGDGNVIPYEVTVTLTDDDGGTHLRTFAVTVQDVPAASGAALAEVQTSRVFVGPLTLQEYQALMGDSGGESAVLAAASMNVAAGLSSRSSRAFVGPLKDGAYSASATSLVLAAADNEAPVLAVIGNTSVSEGAVDFGTIATFLDLDSEGPFLYEIDWGDNSTDTSGQADVASTGPPAVGSIQASHVYGDDGSYVVLVKLTDEDAMSSTEQFALTVVNVAPVANANGPYEVDEFATVQLAGSGTDVAGDQSTLVYEWDLDDDGVFGETGDAATQGDENVQNPLFSAEGIDGPATWTVFLRCRDDGDAVSPIVQATVEIGNSPPLVTVTNASVTVAEGTTATNTGTYSDPGGDPVTLAVSAGTILSNVNGTWNWTSATTDGPDDSKVVTVTATDSDGETSTITFNLVVENVAPTVTSDEQSVTVSEGQTATNTGTYDDLGADTLTLAASVGTIVDSGSGTWSWSFAATDGPGQSQAVSITATDSDGGVSTTTFSLVVENVAPTATVDNGSVAVDEGELATNSGTYQDPGDDTLTFTASAGTVVDNGNGTWSWSLQTTDGPDNSATVTVTVTDKDGGAATVTFDLAVANVAPTVAVDLPTVEVLEGQTATNTGTYLEPGDDLVSFTATVGTIVDNGDSTWSWSFPAADGPDDTQVVTVTVTDSDGEATTVSFDLAVANAPPVANDDYYVFDGIGSLEVDAARGVLANDSDPGDDVIVVDSWGSPSIGSLTEQNPDGSFVYVGPEGYSGTVTFDYTVRDEDGALSERQAVVKIDVGMNSAVTGYVYAKNSDSRFQPAALPLPGVLVTLTAIDDTDLRGVVEINTITDDQGRYSIEGLRAGDYQIVVRQPAACLAGSGLTTTVTLGANDQAEASSIYTGWLRPTSISIGGFLGSTIRTSSTTYGWTVGLRDQMAKAEERAGNTELAASIRLGEAVQIARRGSLVTITGTSLDEAFEMYSDSDGYHVSLGDWNTVYLAGSVSQILVLSGGGDDTAVLHDSALDDILAGQLNSLTLTNDEFVWELRDFSSIEAIADSGGTDTKAATSNIDFVLEISGDWD